MADLVITISSDVLKESVGSVVSQVILFDTIPTKIPIVADIPINLPPAPESHAVSPFLCSDDYESEPNSEPADELTKRHASLRPFSAFHGYIASIITIEIIITGYYYCICRDSSCPLARRTSLSSESSSSNSSSSTSFGSSSDLTSHTSESSSTALLHVTQISLEDHSHHSSEDARSPSGPLTHKRPYLETHAESDIDLDIQADFKAKTVAAAATVDGLGIKPVMAVVETGFEPRLAVVESKSEPAEVEADDEADTEIQPEGTIEIRVDVTNGIDIPTDMHMPDTIERLEQLEEGVQERVVAIKCSNMRLQDALGAERVRADSLQRRLSYVKDELRQIRKLRSHKS
uniref:Uncharacterized protein n=1 Tax=Tanacetum cinerariifolium TaxID=118510 RepID=A0A6L2LDI6_TANCI|nr:hypothetical protein [Tanacetum cinerariifolium]